MIDELLKLVDNDDLNKRKKEIIRKVKRLKRNETFSSYDWQKQVAKMLEKMQETLKEHTLLLKAQGSSFTEISTIIPDSMPKLPVDKVEDLGKWENFLWDTGSFDLSYRMLSQKGGNSIADCTRRILQSLLTNQLSTKFNWKGQRGEKLPFSNLQQINKLIIDTVRSNRDFSEATEAEIQFAIKTWLMHAKDRDGGRSKRSALQHTTASNSE